jgi:hypothetical protein
MIADELMSQRRAERDEVAAARRQMHDKRLADAYSGELRIGATRRHLKQVLMARSIKGAPAIEALHRYPTPP